MLRCATLSGSFGGNFGTTSANGADFTATASSAVLLKNYASLQPPVSSKSAGNSGRQEAPVHA